MNSHNWVFTINNFTEEDEERVRNLDYKAIVAGREKGESGTPHIQGAVSMKKRVRLAGMKKLLPRAHLEVMKGRWKDQKYCEKEGDILIKDGTCQGERTDLHAMKAIVDGGGSLLECVNEDVETAARYYRFIEKYEDLIGRAKYRTEMTKGIWYWGETGVGKSHKAFEGFDPKTHYVWNDDNGWWDGYTGQETVIMNDFRGQVKYGEMLNLVDKWRHNVRRRGREPVAFVAKTVIVTSSLEPKDVYKNRNEEDSLEQFNRRFEIIKL